MIFHWGLYSIPGIVESWSICSEDVDWINRSRDLGYEEYKQWYWGLKDRFDPSSFDPEEWAEIMEEAGMRYMIFTTKHHDGFCMFDTGVTDFSIAATPFFRRDSTDITLEILEAFRDKVSSYRVCDLRLAAFERVSLAPGESSVAEFTLDKDALAYYFPDGRKVFEDGEFEIMAGASSTDIRSTEILKGKG